VTESVLPQVIAFTTSVMKGLIASPQLVDGGAVVMKLAASGEWTHRRRSALGVMDRYGARLVGSSWPPPRSVSHRDQPSKVTAEYGSPPEIAGHAGAGVGLYVLVRPPAAL
jgi:hypothetical protein